MFTKQETFNTVVAHARKQKVRATDMCSPGNGCKYRTVSGLKCFAGALIPDYEYRPTFEDTGVLDLNTGEPTSVGDLLTKMGYDYLFVNELQAIHDMRNSDITTWEPEFHKLAEKHGLVVPT